MVGCHGDGVPGRDLTHEAAERALAEQVLAELSSRLLSAVEAAVGPWVDERIRARVPDVDRSQDGAAGAARQATETVTAELARLFERDIDQQTTTPLSILRGAPVRLVTEALRRHGVPPVDRDEQARALHPDDPYDLTPGAFADFGDEVHQAGLLWGAAKAHLHLQRHANRRDAAGRDRD